MKERMWRHVHIVAYSWVKLGMIKGETFSQLKMHCHLGFVFHCFNYAMSKWRTRIPLEEWVWLMLPSSLRCLFFFLRSLKNESEWLAKGMLTFVLSAACLIQNSYVGQQVVRNWYLRARVAHLLFSLVAILNDEGSKNLGCIYLTE